MDVRAIIDCFTEEGRLSFPLFFFFSVDQILTHQYAEKLLFLRLCFRKAKECARKGKAVQLKSAMNILYMSISFLDDDSTSLNISVFLRLLDDASISLV